MGKEEKKRRGLLIACSMRADGTIQSSASARTVVNVLGDPSITQFQIVPKKKCG